MVYLYSLPVIYYQLSSQKQVTWRKYVTQNINLSEGRNFDYTIYCLNIYYKLYKMCSDFFLQEQT
jgi:hypothetical protein